MSLQVRLYLQLTLTCLVGFVLLGVFVPANAAHLPVMGAILTLMLVAIGLLVRRSLNQLNDENLEARLQLTQAERRLEEVQNRFAELTTRDELTGCSNERHLLDSLLQHRAMSDRGDYAFTLVVSQVDQFDDLVATHGLARGHELLQLFASILKAALREVDVIARLDTDRFAWLLSGAGESDALSIMSRVSSLIAQIKIEGVTKVTTSGGITTYHGSESSEDLVAHAEQALAFAAAEGWDRVAGYNYVAPVLAGSEMDEPS